MSSFKVKLFIKKWETSKYSLGKEIYEMFNDAENFVRKEYKFSYDSVRKVTNRKMCNWLLIDHDDKWYMHKIKPGKKARK